MMEPIHSEQKAALRAEHKAKRRAAKAIRHRQYRCFWTRPFGHEWKATEYRHLSNDRFCVGCGYEKAW